MTSVRTVSARTLCALVDRNLSRARRVEADTHHTLLEVLRRELRLVGAREGCGVGMCGACTVLLDGQAVRSCLLFAVQADGATITSAEGLVNEDGSLGPVQEAFRQCHDLQCGFCTPGFIVATYALLRDNPEPSEAEIREALSGNLCRCTGYGKIVEAIAAVAARGQGHGR